MLYMELRKTGMDNAGEKDESSKMANSREGAVSVDRCAGLGGFPYVA